MMAWLKYTRNVLHNMPMNKDPFAEKLEQYLRNADGVAYTEAVLQQTIIDVMNLDEDLLAFVKVFVEEKRMEGDQLRCDHFFTMTSFLEETDYTPVAAALLFQMYRWNPTQALKVLAMHDEIIADPQSFEMRETE